MFDNAGKLSDLKTMIQEGADVSQENLEAIIRNTTKVIEQEGKPSTLAGPFAQFAKLEEGVIIPILSDEKDIAEMSNKITQNKDEILENIENYVKTKEELDLQTGGNLSNDQLSELTWLSTQSDNWTARGKDIAKSFRPAISKLIGTIDKSKAQIHLERIEEGSKSIEPSKRYNDLVEQEEKFK